MNPTEIISLHQQLINEACAYKNEHNLAYAPFIEALDKRHQAAILFKDLNYQVINGGFYQWSDNKMGTDSNVELLLGYSKEINTNSSISVLYILEKFKQIKASIHLEIDQEEDYSAYDNLNSDYIKFSRQLLIDVNEWLATIPES